MVETFYVEVPLPNGSTSNRLLVNLNDIRSAELVNGNLYLVYVTHDPPAPSQVHRVCVVHDTHYADEQPEKLWEFLLEYSRPYGASSPPNDGKEEGQ